ncbi:MAG: HEAT repeat domain-containing protein [Candidatus Zixiibacteriota bacterium]
MTFMSDHRWLSRFAQAIGAIVLTLVVASCGTGEKATRRKLAQIAVWEDQGWTANGKLLSYLSDRNEQVRERAMLAVGRVNDTLAIDSVRRVLLDDPSAKVRAMAACAFGIWQWKYGKDALLQAVAREQDPGALIAILQGLGRVYARDEYQRYIHLLHHADPRVRLQTAQTLDLVNRRDVVDSVLPLCNDPDPTIRRGAIYSLIRCLSKPAAEWAAAHRHDPDPTTRGLLYRLAASGRLPSTSDIIVEGLDDPDPRVRTACADALLIARDTTTVSRVLPRLETETDPGVVTRLTRAIGEHWYPPALPALRKLLHHPEPAVRLQATLVLCNQRDLPCGESIVPAAADPNPLVRLAFLDALEKAQRFAPIDTTVVLPALRTLISDPFPPVRAGAAKSYIYSGGSGWDVYLNQMLHDPDPQVVTMAVGLIGTLKLYGYVDSLHALFRAHRQDPNPDVKWAILASGTNLLPTVRIDSIRQDFLDWGMADPNRLVRWYTIAVAFKFRKDLRDGLGVYKTDLTVDNLDSLLPRYATPPLARLETTKGPITIRLDTHMAPRTVRQFISIARAGIYDHAPITDYQPGSVIQCSDSRGDGGGFPPANVRDEYSPRRIGEGSVFWNSATRDTGRGIFSIALTRLPYQDWRYAVFGEVVEGMDVARSLTLADSIRSVTISTAQP